MVKSPGANISPLASRLLIITFVMAIIKKEFLAIGKLALGGTSIVATLVGFEIADALLDLREQK